MSFEQIDRMNAQDLAVRFLSVRTIEPGQFPSDPDGLMQEVSRLTDFFSGIPQEDTPPPPGFVCEWRGMHFRSKTERRVARALERANVMFFPNARGRLGVGPDYRESREPDFLVVQTGKLGILEVDGDRAHPPERAAADHARDRLFRQHGIRVFERYSANQCYEDADRVVAEFLQLLDLNG